MNRLLGFAAGVIFGAAGAATAATTSRIVINDSDGVAAARALGAPFSSVVEIASGPGGSPFCTGSLITPTVVLTAKHCTDIPGSYAVNFTNGSGANLDSFSATVTNFGAPSPLLDGTDISILTLGTAATGYTPMKLAESVSIGEMARIVGFGLNGVGSTGHQFSSDGFRWAVDNVIDAIGQAADPFGPISGTTNILSTDFDDGTSLRNTMASFGSSPTPVPFEGTTAPGDSGGPLLVMRGGEWVVGGVLSGGTTSTSVYGDISWWTGTYDTAPRAFVEANAPGVMYVSEVVIPLPASVWMLLAALGGAAAMRHRRGNAT